MRSNASIFLFAICTTLTIVGCIETSSSDYTNEETTLPPESYRYKINFVGDTARYSMQLAYQVEDGSDNYEKEGLTKIILSYPLIDSFSNLAVKDSINSIITDLLLKDPGRVTTYEDVESYMKEFIRDFAIHKKEMKEFGLPFSSNWFFELHIDFLLNAPQLMSLKVQTLEFTGGAHANPWTNYLNIDMRSGKVLTLEDLLVGDYESQLLMVAESHFKTATNLTQDTNLLDTNFEFTSGDFMLPENFSIHETGFSFHYNPYDLGPFALGAISFEIPYEDMLSMINRDLIDLVAELKK